MATTGCNTENSGIDPNLSLQEQLDQAMESIITYTENNPIFEEIVEEAVEKAASQFPPEALELEYTEDLSTPTISPVNNEVPLYELQTTEHTVPAETIKQRLRPRKSTGTAQATESPKRSKKKRGKTIEVISNEPYQGDLPQCVVPTQENQQSALITSSGTIYLNVPSSMQMPFFLTSSSDGGDGQQSQFVFNPSLCVPSLVNTTASINPNTIISSSDFQNQFVIQNLSDPNVCQYVPYQAGQKINENENSIIILDEDGESDPINLVPNSEQNNENAASAQDTGAETTVSSTDAETNTNTTEQKANTPLQPVQQSIPIVQGLSTPRTRTSHIRILDFTTPPRNKKGEIQKKTDQCK